MVLPTAQHVLEGRKLLAVIRNQQRADAAIAEICCTQLREDGYQFGVIACPFDVEPIERWIIRTRDPRTDNPRTGSRCTAFVRCINDGDLGTGTRKMKGGACAQNARADDNDLHDNSLRWHDPEQVRGYDLSPRVRTPRCGLSIPRLGFLSSAVPDLCTRNPGVNA